MQPVRTKQKAYHSRRRALWVALALIAVTAAAILMLQRGPIAQKPEESGGQTVLTLLDHAEDTLERITVHPSRSEAYTLVRTEAGMRLEGRQEYPLREETVRVLVYYATHLTADEVAYEPADVRASHREGADRSEYGLDPGTCSAEVTLSGGISYTVTLGSAVPMEEVRYYAGVSGDPNIYTVTSDVMDALNVQFYTLHPVPALAIDADLIDRVSLSDGTGTPAFTAARTDAGWMLTEPFRYPLSTEAVERLLSSLESLRFSTWVGEDTPLNRRQYGFDVPAYTFSIDFAPSVLTVPDEEGNEQAFDIPASSITILQGAAYSDTAHYYLYNGDIVTGTVVTFSAVNRLNWQSYLSPTPFIYRQNNLSSVSVAYEGNIVEYSVRYVERVLPNNQFETDEHGSIVYEMRVRKNGAEMDAYAFSEYYAKLTALSDAQGISQVPGSVWKPGGADVPLVTVRLSAEDQAETLEIGLYPGPSGKDYLTVDGTAAYTVPAAWAETIRDCP